MEINQNCVVALTWTLQDTLGEELDVLDEPVEFVVGGQDLLPKIEEALQGHEAGASLSLHLEPEDAFGDFDESLVFWLPRSSLPKDMDVGMLIEAASLPAEASAWAQAGRLYAVSEIYPEQVILDGNHPLAGIALRLRLKVHAVREASDEERQSGSCGVGFFKPMV